MQLLFNNARRGFLEQLQIGYNNTLEVEALKQQSRTFIKMYRALLPESFAFAFTIATAGLRYWKLSKMYTV